MLLLLKDTKCNILKLSDGSLMDLIKNSTSDRSSRYIKGSNLSFRRRVNHLFYRSTLRKN